MIYPSIDILLKKVDSKYKLVHIAARRSREIESQKNLQMKESKYKCKKNIGKALEEVMEGYITVNN